MVGVVNTGEAELVRRHQTGDADAFADIVRQYHASLLAHARRRLGDTAAAEDAVQETLLRAYRSLPRFNGEYRLGGWLHRICENVCIDEANRRRRGLDLTDRLSGQALALGAEVPHAGEQAIADATPEVHKALASLPENYREALLLRIVDDLPYDEVAAATGVSEDNARARVSRATRALRRVLGSAVAAVVFVLPFLRRTEKAMAETTAGSASATQAPATASNAVLQLGTLTSDAAQLAAGPAAVAVAQAGPTVATKVTIAVGIVAAVAVPTGVSVVREPAKPAAPPPAEVPAPSDTTTGRAVLLPSPTTTVVVAATAAPTASAAPAASSTTAPAPSTTAAPAGSGDTTPDTTATTQPPAPAPARGASFSSAELTVTEAGPRLELRGAMVVDAEGDPVDAVVTGKLLVGDADPKDAQAPRRLDGSLWLELADGRAVELRVAGSVIVTSHDDGTTTYEVAGPFRLTGDDVGADTGGELTGLLLRRPDGTGTIELHLNGGAPADEPPADDGTSTGASGGSTSSDPGDGTTSEPTN